ncbi:MAG: peptidylprolyl isomerase [Acidimicrobiales bacterium]|nr:peptidylprolyl isomerase [Acidimicrobiales bacterium]
MGTEKRERQKANRAAKLAAEEAAAARKKRITFIRNVVILIVFIALVLVLFSGCSSDDGAAASDAAPVAADGFGTTPCPPENGSNEAKTSFEDSFRKCIDPSKTYTAVITTTLGKVTVELDAEGHPITTNNFVSLARSGYYDGTVLFRTEAMSGIIQGGSPHTQDNSDPGPGYLIPDEGPLATAADYGPGTLAMARTPAPNSAGGQFFFLAGEGARFLGDPSQPGAGTYRVFGRTTVGLDVLQQIAALDSGDGAGTPTKVVKIESVKITEA